MKFQLENGKKFLYELENVNKSSFKNWKKFQLENENKFKYCTEKSLIKIEKWWLNDMRIHLKL